MVEVDLCDSPKGDGYVRVCDFGMTLMRLSYSFDVGTTGLPKISHIAYFVVQRLRQDRMNERCRLSGYGSWRRGVTGHASYLQVIALRMRW